MGGCPWTCRQESRSRPLVRLSCTLAEPCRMPEQAPRDALLACSLALSFAQACLETPSCPHAQSGR